MSRFGSAEPLSEQPADFACFLIVDDDDVDVMMLKRAFSQLADTSAVLEARDGVEALEILRRQNLGHRRFVVLLDLNMPRMNGIEFLVQIRQDDRLRHLPVFVLSTSNSDGDKRLAFDLAISGYFVKPDSPDGFLAIASLLKQYIRTVELPS